jgi:hypothetical protein
VQGIPYIATRKELARQRHQLLYGAAALAATLLAGLIVMHLFVRPLDQLWGVLLSRLLG